MFKSFQPTAEIEVVNDFKEQVVHYTGALMIFIVSLIMFLVGFRRLLPEDLYSTALFFDSLEIAKVFDTPAHLSDDTMLTTVMHLMSYQFQDVSVSAMSIALLLFAAQMIAGYFLAIHGDYTPQHKSAISYARAWISSKMDARRGAPSRLPKLNPDKVFWLWMWVFLAFADTATDVIFRSTVNGQITTASFFWSSVVSILVYNLGSEWATVLGFNLVVSNGYALAVRTWPLLLVTYDTISDLASSRSGMSRITTPPPPPRKGVNQKRDSGRRSDGGRNNNTHKQQQQQQGKQYRIAPEMDENLLDEMMGGRYGNR